MIGVTMWEMWSFGDVPYGGLSWSQEFVYQLMDGLRLLKPRDCNDEMYVVFTYLCMTVKYEFCFKKLFGYVKQLRIDDSLLEQ